MIDKYPRGAQNVKAVYTEPRQRIYRGNPLIEALPENMPASEIYQRLLSPIPYSEEERTYPHFERLDCVQLLYHCFQPWSTHIELAQQVAKALRSGYSYRNPLHAQHIKEMNQLYECVRQKDSDFTNFTPLNAGAPGFSLIGYSGMGKTSAINHVLSMYPQVIVHEKYNGAPFPHLQLSWMKLECPHDGSVKGLCSYFFSQFDDITGDNTYQKFAAGSRVTTDEMIPQMAVVAKRHSLGLLVIDEIQNLSAAKSGGPKKMMNFITQMVNELSIPVLLIGTPEAVEVLSQNMATARRNNGQQGAVIMDYLKKDSPNWAQFLNGLWKYQWTSEKTELTAELSDVLNEESLGIVSVAVYLYAAAQTKAIQRGEAKKSEAITPALLQSVVKSKDFALLRDRLNQLKSGRFVDADNALQRWDALRCDYDTQNLLPKRKETPKAAKPIVRDTALQQSISIPKMADTDVAEPQGIRLVTPDDEF